MSADGRFGWRDVRDRVRERVLSGEFGPGDKLPRDEDLAAELGCARSTVQRAMKALADKGLIERRRKGGSRVREDRITRATLDIPVIRSEVEIRGGTYGYRLVARAVAPPPAWVLERFTPVVPARALKIEALHLADDRPYIYEDRWVSLDTAPEIEGVDLDRISANEWLVRNRPYSRCDLVFHADAASPEEGQMLGAVPGSAVLVIDRTTWIGPRPITAVRAVTRPGYELRAHN